MLVDSTLQFPPFFIFVYLNCIYEAKMFMTRKDLLPVNPLVRFGGGAGAEVEVGGIEQWEQ